MNYYKEKLVRKLEGLHQELKCDDADKSILNLVLKTKDYIREIPVTYDRETVVKAIACYGCKKCTEDFDMNRKRCAKRYEDADIFYGLQILDEHDEDVISENFYDFEVIEEED